MSESINQRKMLVRMQGENADLRARVNELEAKVDTEEKRSAAWAEHCERFEELEVMYDRQRNEKCQLLGRNSELTARVKELEAVNVCLREGEECEAIALEARVKEFIALLDIEEETGSGRPFHPNRITSCRVMAGTRMNEILTELKAIVEEKP